MNRAQIKNPELSSGQVHLWLADIRDWQGKHLILQSLLSDVELQRLARYKIPQKREQFTISRGILRLLLASYTGEDPANLQLKTNLAGKPFLPDSQVRFNLSHSGDHLLLGVTLFDHIGVDIQEIYPISNMDKIIKGYFSDQEYAFLKSQAPENHLNIFFVIWTAKEAYLKALGDGFTLSPRNVDILPGSDPAKSFIIGESSDAGKNTAWTIQTLNLPKRYQGALAVRGELVENLRIPLIPGDFI